MSHLPPLNTPCGADFFVLSRTPADLLLVSVADCTLLTGPLVHDVLQTRDDVGTFVSFMFKECPS